MVFVRRFLILITVILSACSGPGGSQPWDKTLPTQLNSPDGDIELTLELRDGRLYYRVGMRGTKLLADSQLGMRLDGGRRLDEGLTLVGIDRDTHDSVWEQPWGEEKRIRNHYRELVLRLRNADGIRMDLQLRAFDDGIGFRYRWPEQAGLDNFLIVAETTEFNLAKDMRSWSIPSDGDNRYEYLYRDLPASELDLVHTPVTFEPIDVDEEQPLLVIHEAALTDFPSMVVRKVDGHRLKAELQGPEGAKASLATPHQSSWRTLQIADHARDLLSSYMMLNLNEPNALGDVSWVEPGKYVGVWWEMHLGLATWNMEYSDRHGARTDNVKRYIDFAAENGFQGVLVEGWNQTWNIDWAKQGYKFNFYTPYPDFDIEVLSAYGAERGVSIVGHHETGGWIQNYEAQLEQALDFSRSHGTNVIKTGYVAFDGVSMIDDEGEAYKVAHHGQRMVQHFREVIKKAAQRRISIVAHETIKDTGIRRTYPNFLSRECLRGQEFNAWSDDGGNPPEHTVIFPFTRGLAAPVDFTPGVFDLTFGPDKPDNQVNTTLAKQLALYVTIYSPMQMVPDLPENYRAKPDAFQFIKDVPVDWQHSRAIHAKIGDYLTVVRKDVNSNDWYMGSISDENPRRLQTKLDFLDKGREYEAQIYRDAEGAHYRDRPHAYVIESRRVRRGDLYEIVLAAGGGQAVRFKEIH